jgi:hypothetical protein
MSQTLLEIHKALVLDIANVYLDNMELELGKKYKNNGHEVNPSLSDAQHFTLKTKHNVNDKVFADLYSEFQKMEPTPHLKAAMDAFTASGGNVDIEPSYDESTQRLRIAVRFVIKDRTLDKIEGLLPLEDVMLKLNAMHQVDTLLSGSYPAVSPSF